MLSLQHRQAKSQVIKEGSLVYHEIVKQGVIRSKLAPKFEGPFRVSKVIRQKARCINLQTAKETWFHFDTLKLAEHYNQDKSLQLNH